MKAFVCVLVGALAGTAAANGRPAATSTISFRHGHPMDIVAGATFGLAISHDGGATWHWMCEDAVGYGGVFDPVYQYSDSGAIFATTLGGLKVDRDGCTFGATPPGMTPVSDVYIPPGTGHTVFYAAIQNSSTNGSATIPGDSNIYKSTDDGMTFPTSTMPGMVGDWWQSLLTAPSDPNRMYLSGYRFEAGGRGFTMFESTDAGASFSAINTSDFVTSANSAIVLEGISPTNPDVVFAEVTLANGTTNGEGLYRSTDAGASWTKIFDKPDLLSFVARANGTCMVAAQSLGAWQSTDCDDPAKTPTFTALPNPPHINCLVESDAGEVWACTQNYGGMGLQSDGYGIMKSTDLVTWTGVLRFQDIAAPVDCAAGTVQHDSCQAAEWCGVKTNLGITSTAIYCPPPPDGTIARAGTKAGCCDTSGGGTPGALVVSSLVGLALIWPRRRR